MPTNVIGKPRDETKKKQRPLKGRLQRKNDEVGSLAPEAAEDL